MPQSNDEKLHGNLVGSVFAGTSSTDLTTNIVRQLRAAAGAEYTAKYIAMILAAGGKN